MKRKLIFFLVVLFIPFSISGQTNKIRVKFSAASASTLLKNTVNKYFLDNLNTISDLRLVEDKNTFGLEVIAAEIRDSSNRIIGYSLSTVTTNTILCKPFSTEEEKVSPFEVFSSHYITITDDTRIKTDIADIVQRFNNKLNPTREVMKKMVVKIN